MGINHFQEPIGVIIQSTVLIEIYRPQYAIIYIICRFIHLYRVYVKYAGTSLICIWTAQFKFSILFSESLLNIHEDVRRDHWIPIAFMPIYDPNKSIKRPTKSYEGDSARAMRLYHDCWRLILCKWNGKCQNNRVVSIGDGSRHQVRSFLGRLLGDQQVHIVHILTYTWL
jgi:hypothetical protein